VPTHEKITLKLVPTEQLIPHEETVPHLSERLSRRMMKDGVQRDPIVVDEKNKIVLDGMHRLESLKRLGAKHAVCSLVDYSSDEVKLFRWFRFIENPGEALTSRMSEELGTSTEVSMDRHDAMHAPGLTLTHAGKVNISTGDADTDSIVRATRIFDSVAKLAGARVEFLDESAISPELLGGDHLFLLTPIFKKDSVVHVAMEGKLFPPKTTLHVFPLRPMGINYPIDALRSTEEEMLDTILAQRTRRRIGPPSFYGGRLYREPVEVFE
jgi:hypothetical protein